MAQTKIVLAEFQSDYLSTLERIFIREYQYTAEIILLANEEALKEYFDQPKTIDILLIHEDLYDQSFVRHNVSHLFILTEEKRRQESAGELYNNMLYKYLSSKTIIDNVISRSGISHSTNLHSGVAKVLMLFSPVGGAGKTSLAAGICTLIARNFRRVLYIGADGLQTFGWLLKNTQCLQQGAEKTLLQKSKYAYQVVQPMIVQQLYDILPPFSASLASLGLTQEHILFLIDTIKHSGEYDYIIVDSEAEFTQATTKMMAFADQVLLLTEQDELSVYKLACLLNNIDCSDSHKFSIICNKYKADAADYLKEGEGSPYPPIEYLEQDSKISPREGDYIAGLQSVQKIGQLFL